MALANIFRGPGVNARCRCFSKTLLLVVVLVLLVAQYVFVSRGYVDQSWGGRSPSPDIQTSTVFSATPVIGEDLPPCPPLPPNLVGPVKVWMEGPPFEELERMHPELELGGGYRPRDCQSRHKVAIVVPYRDRELQLRIFLHNLHPILKRQQLDYRIYVVEQQAGTKFNRGMLMNVGFAEASKQYDYGCFVFHDVDLLPEDDRNMYSCPDPPRHMSSAVDKFNYSLPYGANTGGVLALNRTQFETINGYSNQFWGWGGEDDDLTFRMQHHGLHVSRYPTNISRYTMIKHQDFEVNPDSQKMVNEGKERYKTDGLNNLKYKRLDILHKRLFTWVYVQLEKE